MSIQKIFISVPKYIFQSKNIYFSTQKGFPKGINISQVSLRPTGRREVSLSNWRIWMDIQNEATTYYFKKLQIWNYISLPWKLSRYQNINANPENLLTECGFTFTPAEADRWGMILMKINSSRCCFAASGENLACGAWLTTCCNFFVNIPLP